MSFKKSSTVQLFECSDAIEVMGRNYIELNANPNSRGVLRVSVGRGLNIFLVPIAPCTVP